VTQPVHWPFGNDLTCLARIHPGNAHTTTPKILSYRTGLELKKAADGNRSARSGWHQVTREDHAILAQETDAVSGLPIVAFLADPSTPEAISKRQASQRARARDLVGVDITALKSEIVGEVVGALKAAGVIKAEPEPAPPPAEEPSPEVEASADASEEAPPAKAEAEAGGDEEGVETVRLLEEVDEFAPKPKRRRKKAAKSGSRKLRLSKGS
jgi:hypothetical protein